MYSIIGLLVLVLDIFAIVKIIQSSASGTEKVLWILGVLIFPFAGMIVWFIAGPGGKKYSLITTSINTEFEALAQKLSLLKPWAFTKIT